MKKILVTGGHLTPALAMVAKLQESNWHIFYAGRKFAMEGDKAISAEWQIIREKNIPFLNVTTGRLQRGFTKHTLWSLLKTPIGFIQAAYYLVKIKPDAILSFGGYVALPFAIAGKLLHFPIITHEQTFRPGLANKIISEFADKICVSWKETQKYFPANKVELTGLPLRQEIFTVDKKLNITSDKPVIYITGGNLGAHAINQVIIDNLTKLLDDFIIIHQCGRSQVYQDLEKLSYLKSRLTDKQKKRYFLFDYIDGKLIGHIFTITDLIITRSGANITAEIISLKKPAILIPLPWSGEGEQLVNAKYLANKNAAKFIEQREMTGELLISIIRETLKDKKILQNNLQKIQGDLFPDAAARIMSIIEACV